MAIVRLDKVQSIYSGNLESLVFAEDQTNGVFAHVGGLVAGERELVNAVQPDATSVATEEVVLHASPEVMYDERKYRLEDFVLKTGQAGRGYHLTEGDIITLTEDLFASAPTVNQFVVAAADSWILAPSADGSGSKFVAEVIEQTTLDGHNAFAIKVKSV
jgi:hypothetical protein